MNILIVDDESYKIKEVNRIILECTDRESINVYHALDLTNAKAYLEQNEINLLILDINMPELIGGDLNSQGGYELIEEIIDSDFIYKPDEIIILTEYNDITKAQFQTLVFSKTSDEWISIIKAKIEYLIIKSNYKKLHNKNKKVAIITAVDIEFNAVKSTVEKWVEYEFENDPTIYYEGTFGNEISIVLAQQSEMGMAAAATLTTKLIAHYNPELIVMPGIAAGISDSHNLGDIIIASEVWNYSSGKFIGDQNSSFSPDPSYFKLNPQILSKARQDYSVVLSIIQNQWYKKTTTNLHVITGPMACGSAVVSSSEIVESLIKKHSRKTIGLDMESYGMFYAAENGMVTNTIPICIKSICDFANSEKNDGYQHYAAYTSANFMKAFIETLLS